MFVSLLARIYRLTSRASHLYNVLSVVSLSTISNARNC